MSWKHAARNCHELPLIHFNEKLMLESFYSCAAQSFRKHPATKTAAYIMERPPTRVRRLRRILNSEIILSF